MPTRAMQYHAINRSEGGTRNERDVQGLRVLDHHDLCCRNVQTAQRASATRGELLLVDEQGYAGGVEHRHKRGGEHAGRLAGERGRERVKLIRGIEPTSNLTVSDGATIQYV